MAPRSTMDRSPGSISDLLAHPSSPDQQVDQTKAKNEPKRVQFAPCLLMIRHIHIDDYSDQEYDDSFYSKKDYKQIRNACRETVKLFSEEALPSDESNRRDEQEELLCFRGLEKTGLQLKMTKLRRKLAREMVFKAQQAQWRKGIIDAASVAKSYSEISRICHFEARVQGLKDEEIIQGERISDVYIDIRCTRLSSLARRRLSNERFDIPSPPGSAKIEPPKRLPQDYLVPYLANQVVR